MIYFHEMRRIEPRSGYGSAFQGLYLALCHLASEKFITCPFNAFKDRPKIELEIFFGQAYEHLNKHTDVFATRYSELKGIFTMWETTRINPEMAYAIEKYFDFIIVPTEWCRRIFVEHFPFHPVYVCPLGIDPAQYPMLERPSGRSPYTFLFQGFALTKDNDRKHHELVLQAFKELHMPDARLVIKTLARASMLKAPVVLPMTEDYRVMLVSDDYSHAEKLSLYQLADFAILPSEGEGVGLAPLEWMATGLPCAFSENTGAAQYCHHKFNFPLVCDVEKPWIHGDGSMATIPSLETIKRAMLFAYENREYVAAIGRQAAYWMRHKHTYDQAAQHFMQIVNKVLDRQPQEVPAVV